MQKEALIGTQSQHELQTPDINHLLRIYAASRLPTTTIVTLSYASDLKHAFPRSLYRLHIRHHSHPRRRIHRVRPTTLNLRARITSKSPLASPSLRNPRKTTPSPVTNPPFPHISPSIHKYISIIPTHTSTTNTHTHVTRPTV